jgi:hypothetical protein
MTAEERQLAGFLIILLNAAREAIQEVESTVFDDLDGILETEIDKLEDAAEVC